MLLQPVVVHRIRHARRIADARGERPSEGSMGKGQCC
uniref:Uncharacterized protein n=1 Tax=Arundo donax TaxID=35708 RepID=A0A0A9FSC8_ARUDO